jgi:hypothetical protein
MRNALAQSSLGEIANDDRAFVHQPAQGDGGLRLREHVAQTWFDKRLADLILNRGDGLGAEMVAVPGVLVLPERSHDGIADVMLGLGLPRHPSVSAVASAR